MNDKWMKDLKTLADRHEMAAPEGLLDDVKREMASGRQPVSVRRRWSRAVALWVGVAAVVAVVVGIVETRRDTRPTPALSSLPSLGGGDSLRTSAYHADPAAQQPHQPTSPPAHRSDPLPPNLGGGATRPTQPTHQPTSLPAHRSDPLPPNLGGGAYPTHQPTNPPTHRSDPLPPNLGGGAYPTYHPTNPPTHQLALAAYYGGATSPSVGTMMGPAYADALVAQNDPRVGGEQNMLAANLPPVVRETHHQPIRLGLSLRYRLSRRWSVTTGVTYSRLSSETTRDYVGYATQTTQRLHYLGVPLSAAYSLWQNRRVNMYVTAGGEVEKLVSGRATTQRTAGGQQPPTTERVSESRPLFSTQAAVGVEVRALDRVSIFAEPGASYHFKNGSGVRSAYTDKPLRLNLSLGVRVEVR